MTIIDKINGKIIEKIPSLRKENRVFIFMTRHGLYYLSIIFILFLISLLYGHNLALAATLLFVSLVMISAIYTNFNIDRISIQRISVEENPTPNNIFEISVILKNNSLNTKYDVDLELGPFKALNKVTIAANEEKEIILSGSLPNRGKYKILNLKLKTTFPFALFFSWSYRKWDKSFLVYPQSKNHLELPEPIGGKKGDEKNNESKEGTNDFLGHKKYVHGEDFKNIDWKVFAKRGEWYQKVFSDAQNYRYLLKIPNDGTLSLENKIEVLTFWVEELFKRGEEYALVLGNESPSFSKGKKAKFDALLKLALYQNSEVQL
jgi:uncharacterized protein (DUF58 family)